jgi:hypothetical protein
LRRNGDQGGIHSGRSERLGIAFAGSEQPQVDVATDDPMILTRSVAISSLLQRTAASSSFSEERAEHAAFSPLALLQRNMHQSNPPPHKTGHGGEVGWRKVSFTRSKDRSGGTLKWTPK